MFKENVKSKNNKRGYNFLLCLKRISERNKEKKKSEINIKLWNSMSEDKWWFKIQPKSSTL